MKYIKPLSAKGIAHLQTLLVATMVITAVTFAGYQVGKNTNTSAATGETNTATAARSTGTAKKIKKIKVITLRKVKGHKEGNLWCANLYVGLKVQTKGKVDFVSVYLVTKLTKRYYTDPSNTTDPITAPDWGKKGDYTPWSLTYRGNNIWGDDDGYYYNRTIEDATTDNAYQTVKACTQKRGTAVNVTAYGYIYAFGPGGWQKRYLPDTYVRIK